MATNARIFKVNGNTVRSVYVHFDGYYNGLGKILYQFYNNESKINDLIALGNLSSVGPNLDSNQSRYYSGTVAYCRDQKEDLDIKEFELEINSAEDLDKIYKDYEYTYIWYNGIWYTSKSGKRVTLLSNELAMLLIDSELANAHDQQFDLDRVVSQGEPRES